MGKNEHKRKEVASLTKMMTLWVVINIIKKYNINPD